MRVPGRLRQQRTAHPPIRGDEDLSVLMVRAAAGEAAAESAFVSRTIDDVWRYCAHLLGPNLADDATQATYLRALRSLGNFRGDSSPRTWLIGVARNTCLDERRSSRSTTRKSTGSPSPRSADPFVTVRARLRSNPARARLPPR